MLITRPDRRACRPHVGECGFAIVSAIFILVVLAGLGGYILSTSSTQSLSLAQDAMNSRARQAARAGIEWATYQVTRASGFQTACQAAAASYSGASPATQVFAPGDLPGLTEFRVDIACRSQSFDEAGASYRVYQLVATACTTAAACPSTAPPGLGYVEHRQTATVRQ